MNFANRILRDPNIMMGKRCVKGTRLTVQLILERLAYHPKEELLACYPDLTADDIQAAILFAASEVGSKMVMEEVFNG